MHRLLVANRGEIALRIIRAAAESGIHTVAIYSEDDAESLHVLRADESYALPDRGPAAYLNADQLVLAAKATGCDAVHPGYGFLSESAAFADFCRKHQIGFVGPEPETLELFGDKSRARRLAEELGVPTLAGTSGPTTLAQAKEFMSSLPPGSSVMIKAIAGGGGRGMRKIDRLSDLEEGFARCHSEALSSFGNGDVYVERLLTNARHIEVQIIGDGAGAVTHLWDRDCTIQRRNQKMIEIAPSPNLNPIVRQRLVDASLTLGRAAKYRGVGTVEFLVEDGSALSPTFYFMEVNARLQVEHTVTEEVTGIDLVKTQLAISQGRRLRDLGLDAKPTPTRGYAIQLRVNAESLVADGSVRPAFGTVDRFFLPTGGGVRVETHCHAGFSINPRYDSLLAKLIVHSPSDDFAATVRRAGRALEEFEIGGAETNAGLLRAILARPEFIEGSTTTRFLDLHLADLLKVAGEQKPSSYPAASVDTSVGAPSPAAAIPDGWVAVKSVMQGVVVSISVSPGQFVRAGQTVLVLESMKMEHPVVAARSGVLREITVSVGDVAMNDGIVAIMEPTETAEDNLAAVEQVDLEYIRHDLAVSRALHAAVMDEARPEAVRKRRAKGGRTARENIDAVCDEGTFVEYGPLVVSGQRYRYSVEELRRRTPADGVITGIGVVNGALFPQAPSRCAIMAYDYTVLAGTQGGYGHIKTDRLYDVAHRLRLPLILFAEGGGGRPGDRDRQGSGGMTTPTFWGLGRLSGRVPLVCVISGYCFAGNAALAGCCDVIIATRNSSIGMGGPAMIEGGGLGVIAPGDVGPASIQAPNGVIDVLVEDEEEAAIVAKKYLAFFQGTTTGWRVSDQRKLRHLIPENRLRSYDVRAVIRELLDIDSMLELRPTFGVGILTALGRVEGRPVGVVANNCRHLGGAIDADAADKSARFMQLCNAHGIPILLLLDTPGFMVGRESEEKASVRHFGRMFVVGANLSVPAFAIVLRKSYGLGAMAMGAGSLKVPLFSVAWSCGEFGGMGIEGAVRLAYRAELEAIVDPELRQKRFEEMVAEMYHQGQAINAAMLDEIDDVIDPADSRRWILAGLDAAAASRSAESRATDSSHSFVDAW